MRLRAGLRLCLLGGLLGAGCGDDDGSTSRLLVGRGTGQVQDGGGRFEDAGQGRSARPPGAPILPMANESVTLDYRAEPVVRSIEIDAEPSTLDVHLSIDTTGSIAGEIDALQRDLEAVLVPELRARVRDVGFGVSRFEDFPVPPFGSPAVGPFPADSPFTLVTPITTDLALVSAAVATLDRPLGEGGDTPESGAEALYQIATGEGYTQDGKVIVEPFDGDPAPGGGTAGGVGFREGALRAVLHVTDTPSHKASDYQFEFPDAHGMDEAEAALRELGIHVIGLVSTPCPSSETCESVAYKQARAELENVAVATSTVAASEDATACPHGLGGTEVAAVDGVCPLVFDVAENGNGLSETLVEAIAGLVGGARFGVVGTTREDPIGFVQRVAPAELRQAPGEEAPEQADLVPASEPDGELDSFVNVRSKARLAFDVWLQNTKIAPTDFDQRFRVIVRVLGDGLLLEERTFRVVVPAGASLAPTLDAAPMPSTLDAAPDADGG